MARPTLAELVAFRTITAHRSFRRAADELGLSASSLSHTMRVLETSLGARLLHRTTRSVSPTEDGERLLARLGPLLEDLDAALDEVGAARDGPRGTVRINAPEGAVRLLLAQVVPGFLARHPNVAVDFGTEGRLVDIVAQGFDAGVRLAESLPQDMIAVSLGSDTRFVVVASPAHVERHGRPTTPDDLEHRACIRQRLPSGRPYRWEFERAGRTLAVDVPGRLTLDHNGLMVEAAADGLGFAYVPESAAQEHLEDGRLVTVLDDWCPPIPGLFLYYSGHRRVPTALRAFVDAVKETSASSEGAG